MPEARESTREFPRLAEGLEFGPEETAGGSVIAFLPPDRFVEVSSQTARILRLVDGRRDIRTLAELASAELSSEVSPAAFQALLEESLVPRGLIRYGEPAPAIPRSGGRRRVQFIPARVVAALARALGLLYRPPIAPIAVAVCVGAQLWFFIAHSGARAGAASSMVWGWLAAIVLYLISMLLHELGHATALRTFGVDPGAIGLSARRGEPLWSSDVTGVWKLRRRQRVVVDLGGIYFQSLFVGALIVLHATLPGLLPGIVVARVVAIVDVIVLFNLAPLWRSDGFWLAADLAGTRYPRADAPMPGDRGSPTASATTKVPGAYGGLYALAGSAGFAGLCWWLAGHPGFDAGLGSTRVLDGPSFITMSLSFMLRMLALAGLALSIWTGLAWIARGARTIGRPGLSQALQSIRMEIEAGIRVRAGGQILKDALGLLPVFIATTIGTDVAPRRLRSLARRFLRTQAVLKLEHELLPGGARCHEVRNAEPVLDLGRRHAGVLVCSLHFGPYFCVGSELLALGLDVNLLASSAMIQKQDGMWQRVAQVHGRRLDLLHVERLSGTRSIMRILQGGGLVLLYVDGQGGLAGPRSGKSHRTQGSFLSMRIRMWTGPAYLAQRAGAQVVFATVWREAWGKRVLEFSDPMRVPAEGGEHSPATFTQDMYRWFEQRVRPRPEQWGGWGIPHLFLEETGAAPRATADALERERHRVAELLRAPGGRTRLRAEPTRVGFLGEGDRYSLIEGPTRRLLEVDALTVAVVGAAFRGVRLGRLSREVSADVPRLSDVVARLTLAGLARLEGPDSSTA